MIKKLFSSKKAEGYVDVCITTVIFVMLTVVALNIFSFITLKADMDQIADDLIIVATHSGRFDTDFEDTNTELSSEYFNYSVNYGADRFFTSGDKVQLGDKMWVEISVDTTVKGLGVFKMPLTLKVKRSGLSEVYWK